MPSSFHWPPFALWLTLAIESPPKCEMVTGTLFAWFVKARHQSETRYVPPPAGTVQTAVFDPLPVLLSCR